MSDALRLYALKGVVTGAADGIGEAIARTLAKQGADVLAVDAPATHIGTSFGKVRGITALALEGDSRAVAELLARAVRERLEGLDILVNNFADSLEQQDDSAGNPAIFQGWLGRIRETTGALLPLLRKSPAGRIINIGALRSVFGPDGFEAYKASELALAKFTAGQAAEYGSLGITANYIQPGAIMTPSSRAVFDADKGFRDRCIALSAAKRLGEPVDIAKVALFLASDDSVFVSGTGIVADGGSLPDADSSSR